MRKPAALILLLFLFSLQCKTPTAMERKDAADAVIKALQKGWFDVAIIGADRVIKRDSGNCHARLVRAIARYMKSAQRFSVDGMAILNRGSRRKGFDLKALRSLLEKTDDDCEKIEDDLAVAARCSDIYINLSPALWQFDWNQDGTQDRRDTSLLEIELDADGKEIPIDDPRRRPMYRFDHGDVYWAGAFISFHRAVISLALAFDWSGINDLIRGGMGRNLVLHIELKDKSLIRKARQQILKGLGLADRARESYLAETDDEREWLPNPSQKNHPLPLPVTPALYETWKSILQDLKRLVRGFEGIRIADVADLFNVRMRPAPKGYLDIGKMFSSPRDIHIDIIKVLGYGQARDVEGFFKSIFGSYYHYGMKPSPMVKRLKRMKNEIDIGREALGRKLRYLLWLN